MVGKNGPTDKDKKKDNKVEGLEQCIIKFINEGSWRRKTATAAEGGSSFAF